MSPKRSFRKLMSLPNWELKLLALLLAVLTYSAIRGATGYNVEYSVPVRVDVDPGMAVLALNPDSVDVRFRGSQEDLLKLEQKRLEVHVRVREDIGGGVPRAITISKRDIVGAPGVSVEKVDPPEVMVTFDRETDTTFSVAKPAVNGHPLIGKVELQFTPQKVTLWGPKTRLDELKAEGHDVVTTDPVDVDGRVESFTRKVKVHAPSGTWASRIEPEEITVQVIIVKKSTTRSWAGLAVVALDGGSNPGRIFFDPPQADVVLEGRSELLENISERDILLFVDCMGLDRAAAYELPVQVHLPVHMDVSASVTPKTVKVSFENL